MWRRNNTATLVLLNRNTEKVSPVLSLAFSDRPGLRVGFGRSDAREGKGEVFLDTGTTGLARASVFAMWCRNNTCGVETTCPRHYTLPVVCEEL